MPLPTVAATLRWKSRKAMKLKNAAQRTAACGLSTRVETTVATELAASWKPLRKSKTRARTIRAPTARVSCENAKVPSCIDSKCIRPPVGRQGRRSRPLDDDPQNHVGNVLAG